MTLHDSPVAAPLLTVADLRHTMEGKGWTRMAVLKAYFPNAYTDTGWRPKYELSPFELLCVLKEAGWTEVSYGPAVNGRHEYREDTYQLRETPFRLVLRLRAQYPYGTEFFVSHPVLGRADLPFVH